LVEGADRLEILLVLPIVLAGLGAFYLDNSRVGYLIGAYIKDHLWARMHEGAAAPRVSWETYIEDHRGDKTGPILGVVPGLLIFVAPSATAIIANADGGLLELKEWPSDRLASGLHALLYVDLVALLALVILVPLVFFGRASAQQHQSRT
jgi:hypothetical protein